MSQLESGKEKEQINSPRKRGKNSSPIKEQIKDLKALLKQALDNCEIENGYPFFPSYMENLSNFAKEAKEYRKEWLTLQDVCEIVQNNIISVLSDMHLNEEKTNGRLKDFIGEKGIEKTLNTINDYIKSIPRKYSFYFPMKSLNAFRENNIQLSKNISIVNGSQIPRIDKVKLSWLLGTTSILKEMMYICIVQEGYAGQLLESSAFLAALSKFKQIVYLGVLFDIFKKNEFHYLNSYPSVMNVVILDNVNQNNTPNSVNLLGDICDYM